MTALARDQVRQWGAEGPISTMPVKAATKIYQGAAIGDDGSGYARGLVAGDPFRGFAFIQADNSAGAAGDIDVQIREEEYAVLNISGFALADVGKPVYASDDNTFTLTATGNSYVGRAIQFMSSGVALVKYSPCDRLGSVAPLAGTLTGTTDGTIADVAAIALSTGNTYTDAAVNSAVNTAITSLNLQLKELQEKLNLILNQTK